MLVGLAGKARAGKDFCANEMCHSFSFYKTSFAEPLKKLCSDLFDMAREQLHGGLKEVIDERYRITPRWLMQYLGTDVLRKIYPNIWTDYFTRDYIKRDKKKHRIVIPDVRFVNEVDAIKNIGGVVWKIVRLGDYKSAESGIKNHPSETELDSYNKFDLVIEANSGNLRTLRTKILNATEEFLRSSCA